MIEDATDGRKNFVNRFLEQIGQVSIRLWTAITSFAAARKQPIVFVKRILKEGFSKKSLDNVFPILQVIKCAIEVNGGNNVKPPRMKKAALWAQYNLPKSVGYEEATIKKPQDIVFINGSMFCQKNL
ncbi:hypothetical protein ABEB36_011361 [Hypothenemus hampei]|uniref:Uncharacterized protein n=1 Tax=Hypothenemus hampei TaxID=57062 RepID=A0ABD1EH76_HYPHA